MSFSARFCGFQHIILCIKVCIRLWRPEQDSNPRPIASKASTLSRLSYRGAGISIFFFKKERTPEGPSLFFLFLFLYVYQRSGDGVVDGYKEEDHPAWMPKIEIEA